MSQINSTRLKQLTEGLVPKEQALKKLSVFGKCSVVPFGDKKITFSKDKSHEDVVLAKMGSAINSEEFHIDKTATQKLCSLMGIHGAYVEKTPVELFFPHMEYWINEGKFTPKGLAHGEKEGRRRLVGFMKESAEYYPVTNVFPFADEVDSNYVVEGLDSISSGGGAIGIVYPKHEFDLSDVKVGDYLYGGIKVRFSIFGDFPISLSVFVLTLSCLNGMVSYQELYSYNRKTMKSLTEDAFVKDSFSLAFKSLDGEIERVKGLTSVKVEPNHIVPYVESAFNSLGIGSRTRKLILEEIIAKNPKTMYDLLNAITGSVKRLENKQMAYKVQRLGGFVSNHVSKCPSCYRPV